MKPLVTECVKKAEDDYRVATQLLAMEDPIYDAVCGEVPEGGLAGPR